VPRSGLGRRRAAVEDEGGSMDAEGQEIISRAEEPDEGRAREGRGPAILLTAAAVAVAVVGGRASLRSADATYLWHDAVRQEVRQAAAYVEDIRFVYSSEAPVALKVTEARLRQEELAKAIPAASPMARSLLQVEQAAQSEVAKALTQNVDLVSDPRYQTPDGFDIASRLADARARNPELVATNPDIAQSEGDDASHHAIRLVAVTPLIAGAFLCGSLAQGVPRRRRGWLILGSTLLVAGVVAAVAVEVVT
jgi:hypothetical protein